MNWGVGEVFKVRPAHPRNKCFQVASPPPSSNNDSRVSDFDGFQNKVLYNIREFHCEQIILSLYMQMKLYRFESLTGENMQTRIDVHKA